MSLGYRELLAKLLKSSNGKSSTSQLTPKYHPTIKGALLCFVEDFARDTVIEDIARKHSFSAVHQGKRTLFIHMGKIQCKGTSRKQLLFLNRNLFDNILVVKEANGGGETRYFAYMQTE